MFKILLLGIWYGLNDEALEERINDAISLSRFLGISIREFDLSNRQERGMYKLLGGVDGGLFVEKGESSQSR